MSRTNKMNKKRRNTIGTIIDTSGCAPQGTISNGVLHNAPASLKAETEAGQKTLDKVGGAIEEVKKSAAGQKIAESAEKAEKLLAKGDIGALKKLSSGLNSLFDKGAAEAGGNAAAAAGLAFAYALKEVFMPTNALDAIPVGKIVTKGKKAIKAVKALAKTEKAAAEVKAVEKAANAGKKGSKGGHVSVKRMPEHKVKCFKPGEKLKDTFKNSPKKMEKEFYKQLKKQEEGINKMTVGEYLENRKAFDAIGRGAGQAQEKAREKLQSEMKKSIEKRLEKQNIIGPAAKKEAAKLASEKMKSVAALHDPDMIAGGHDKIGGFGDSSVNSSIGSQWSKDGRVTEMDKKAQEALDKNGPNAKMNVKLERCK